MLADLRDIDCDILTLGQYLAPTLKHSRSPASCRRRNSTTSPRWPRSRLRQWSPGPFVARVITPTKWCPIMRIPILMPDLGVPRATLSVWFVEQGGVVDAGDRLLEILAGPAIFDLSAPACGKLVERPVSS